MAAIQPATADDEGWLAAFLEQRWGSSTMVIDDEQVDLLGADAVVARDSGRRVGLATFRPVAGDIELLSLDSVGENRGVGTALLDAVIEIARSRGAGAVRLTTTNDNLRALGFYQRRGFQLTELRAGAVDRARRRKPSLPLLGENRIPLRDELDLRLALAARA